MSSWYYSKNLKPHGPLSFDEMKKKIMRGEVGPTDLAMKERDQGFSGEWKAACEWRDFTATLFPAFQKNYFKSSDHQEKEWILLVFDGDVSRQDGPFSAEDIQKYLLSGRVVAEDYVWRSGLTGWVQVRDRHEFLAKPISPDL
ncbi:MAG: DUF4339 domain-containing protein [Bdellovibrionaceae bacterium]|nr:DUF4339 domain-containing protein [Pseudobdellovibrionaceae bacterium]